MKCVCTACRHGFCDACSVCAHVKKHARLADRVIELARIPIFREKTLSPLAPISMLCGPRPFLTVFRPVLHLVEVSQGSTNVGQRRCHTCGCTMQERMQETKRGCICICLPLTLFSHEQQRWTRRHEVTSKNRTQKNTGRWQETQACATDFSGSAAILSAEPAAVLQTVHGVLAFELPAPAPNSRGSGTPRSAACL